MDDHLGMVISISEEELSKDRKEANCEELCEMIVENTVDEKAC